MPKHYLIAVIGGLVAGFLLQAGNIPFNWHNVVYIGGALLTVYVTGVAAEAARNESA